MITNAAEARRIEYRRRNDLADKCQDRQISLEGNKLFRDFRRFERFVLMHRDTQLKRPLLDRIDFSAGRIGKTKHGQDLFPFVDEFIESLLGKRCLSNQNDAHALFPLFDDPRKLANDFVIAA